MSTFRIAVIGSTGQLGTDLVEVFRERSHVLPYSQSDFDILDYETMLARFQSDKPTHVLNTAAFHAVGECERDPTKSFTVNAIGEYHVAMAAAKVNASVLYLSTDYVFPGTKVQFLESDTPCPLNVYGASKLAGEQLTRIGNESYIVVRTSGLFGRHDGSKGPNFIRRLLERARNGEEINMDDDQFIAPTYTHDLAFGIREMLEKQIPPGVYHLTNTGSTSWYGLATLALSTAEVKADMKRRSTNMTIKPVRPLKSVLKSEKIEAVGVTPLPRWEDAVERYIHEHES